MAALGGGHGLAATLSALRRVTDRLTAIVTVADDGGSSGRLRKELGILPPGDLRMALAALCGDDDWGRTWSDVVQHRFVSGGDLHGHAVGNVLIAALWELLGDTVPALDLMGRLLRAEGRVLPMSTVPLDLEATVVGLDPDAPYETSTVRGQVEVATTPGRVAGVSLVPSEPPACPEALTALRYADWVILGPGSWFTSVIPHLLVPDLAEALTTTQAARVVVLNLEPQAGETSGFSPETHLEVLGAHAPELRLDAVICDPRSVHDEGSLRQVAGEFGAALLIRDVSLDDGSARHDIVKLAAAFGELFAKGARARMPAAVDGER
ncbi:MAG: gluconeogenesis factor YvcK family protein [Actinomycetales bacterium]